MSEAEMRDVEDLAATVLASMFRTVSRMRAATGAGPLSWATVAWKYLCLMAAVRG